LVLRTLADLGETSSEAAALLKAGRPGGIAPLVNRARQGLQTLGLETPVLTRVLETGLACSGATAGKLSGAGGGGAFFLVFDSEAMARQAIPVIDKAVESSFWTARPQMIKNLY
jgi:mevalonate kinase